MCVSSHLCIRPNDRTESQSFPGCNPHGLALRAWLFLRTQERKQKLSLTQWGENREMEEYEISSPLGEFTPQWYLLPYGPTLSITHRHTPQVCREGQAHAEAFGVWIFCETKKLNRFQGDGKNNQLILLAICQYSSNNTVKMNRRGEIWHCFAAGW